MTRRVTQLKQNTTQKLNGTKLNRDRFLATLDDRLLYAYTTQGLSYDAWIGL